MSPKMNFTLGIKQRLIIEKVFSSNVDALCVSPVRGSKIEI